MSISISIESLLSIQLRFLLLLEMYILPRYMSSTLKSLTLAPCPY